MHYPRPKPTLATVLRSLAFNIAFYSWFVVIATPALTSLFLPRPVLMGFARTWARGNLWLLKTICRIDYQVRGQENLPDGAFIIASKHQSAWDTIVFILLARDPAYVFKRELSWIPMFGWFLWKADMIPVDRSAGRRAVAHIAKLAAPLVAAKRQIVIFPQGTRTPPGSKRPYRGGVHAIYAGAGVQLVPAALNSGLYWARRSFIKHPGTILLEFLPPIPVGLEREELLQAMEQAIDPVTERLEAEALKTDFGKVGMGRTGNL